MDIPRIAVIGAGALSSRRIYPYVGAAGARLVGVCDLDLDRAQRMSLLFGGHAYDQWPAMLEATRPDGVIICIGPEQHAALAPAVLRAGYPVYTEKPPGPTAADTLKVARAAAETHRLCMTAFKKRYARCNQRAKAFLGEFADEDKLALSLDYAGGPYRNDSPRTDLLLDFGVHGVDLLSFLGGPVAEVAAHTRDGHAYTATIRFASGLLGSFCLTDGRSFGVPTEELEITCRGGHWMTVHNSSCWKVARAGSIVEYREPPTFTSAGDDGRDTGHLAELEAYVQALRARAVSSPSQVYESYRSMVLLEAIREAAASGRAVQPVYEPVETG